MSTPVQPWPANLIISVLGSKWKKFWPGLLNWLESEFGRSDYKSSEFEFTETDYYDAELGEPISRVILGFEHLFDPGSLVKIKQRTNYLEQKHATPSGDRIFNLDPGFLFLERLVLATGKNYSHRIYLGQGIWGDLTLIFQKGEWKTLPWTYPDYASARMQGIFMELRRQYKKKLKDQCG